MNEGLLVAVLDPLITTQRRSDRDAKDVKVEVSFAIASRLKLLSRLGFERVTVATVPSPPAGACSTEQRTSASLLLGTPSAEVGDDAALFCEDAYTRNCRAFCRGRDAWVTEDERCLKQWLARANRKIWDDLEMVVELKQSDDAILRQVLPRLG